MAWYVLEPSELQDSAPIFRGVVTSSLLVLRKMANIYVPQSSAPISATPSSSKVFNNTKTK